MHRGRPAAPPSTQLPPPQPRGGLTWVLEAGGRDPPQWGFLVPSGRLARLAPAPLPRPPLSVPWDGRATVVVNVTMSQPARDERCSGSQQRLRGWEAAPGVSHARRSLGETSWVSDGAVTAAAAGLSQPEATPGPPGLRGPRPFCQEAAEDWRPGGAGPSILGPSAPAPPEPGLGTRLHRAESTPGLWPQWGHGTPGDRVTWPRDWKAAGR